MRPVLVILNLFWKAGRWPFLGGWALTVVTLLAGIALLGLSGWFITASALAGIAGLGLMFDFFRPSAGIRFLALLRTFARYGERYLTHDATLSFLAVLRKRLFQRHAALDFIRMGRLRSGEVLARITSDVDALDGVYLRLFVPVAGAVVAIVVTSSVLLAFSWQLGLVVGVLSLAGLGLALWLGVQWGMRPGRKAALAREALRIRLIDLSKGLVELHFTGQAKRQRAAILKADAVEAEAGRRLAWAEYAVAQIHFLTGQASLVAVLLLGVPLVAAGEVPVAVLALVLLVVFGLLEASGAVTRGVVGFGRTALAARRLVPFLDGTVESEQKTTARPDAPSGVLLGLHDVSFRWGPNAPPVVAGFNLKVRAGDRIALVGRSGAGKSTILAMAAGLVDPHGGQVKPAEEAVIGLLPQKSALFAGTIAENLRLAQAAADQQALWEALTIAQLADEVAALPQGLDTVLGERGAGLSGGQLRRLAIARLALMRPGVFLLDEPTEGLGAEQGEAVLKALFAAFPQAGFVVATHKSNELRHFEHVVETCTK